jgi:YD repeat-containing protein
MRFEIQAIDEGGYFEDSFGPFDSLEEAVAYFDAEGFTYPTEYDAGHRIVEVSEGGAPVDVTPEDVQFQVHARWL